ncbi:hypothetical protein [Polymorphum gilvum]|uniref:Tat pathway signal sequence domain protein n=1 Tax=Polymorphum gilvum (strain LMG 25793 / CGMCC 1.9160 / SL003B-26A1) TaxID=991905 RepID=F2IYX7_POLGS|nr:hypothetical protein [Polymorphum gilvum]ADZ70592.1 hypothetical protein SL003B_2167 [Polymorphum gilvum SL003B-26A1]
MIRSLRILAVAVLLCAPAFATAAGQEGGGLVLELNKAETVGGACRVTLLVRNDMSEPLTALAVDLVVFDKDEGVSGYAGVDLGALPAGKTRVQQYDVAKSPCEEVSRLLVNDVRTCDGVAVAPGSCLGRLRLKSRLPIDLIL